MARVVGWIQALRPSLVGVGRGFPSTSGTRKSFLHASILALRAVSSSKTLRGLPVLKNRLPRALWLADSAVDAFLRLDVELVRKRLAVVSPQRGSRTGALPLPDQELEGGPWIDFPDSLRARRPRHARPSITRAPR